MKRLTLDAAITAATFGLVALALIPVSANAQSSNTLLGSTNFGQLVEIDLSAGTVQVIGAAPSIPGWADLAMDRAGNLYALSRWRREPPSVCGLFGTGSCAHLYLIDPNTGAVIQHIGDLRDRFFSDIEFVADGSLYGNRFRRGDGALVEGGGGLLAIDPVTASTVTFPSIHFGPGPHDFDLVNGGLAQNPVTGELWAVESKPFFSLPPSIFRVDASTGLAIGPVVLLGSNGAPLDVGFDGLEILQDGRFVATRGGGPSPGAVYEINPVPSPSSGLAEVTLIPLTFDPTIDGKLNGLTAPIPVFTVAIDNKPGSDPNCFNLNGKGVIPVAILGARDFDVGDVDFDSLLFDGLAVRVRWNREPLCSFEHVNEDLYLDLVCQFEDDPENWTGGGGTATLSGNLFDGTPFQGTDSICIVP